MISPLRSRSSGSRSCRMMPGGNMRFSTYTASRRKEAVFGSRQYPGGSRLLLLQLESGQEPFANEELATVRVHAEEDVAHQDQDDHEHKLAVALVRTERCGQDYVQEKFGPV